MLLSVINGSTDTQKLSNLRLILQNSNAADMAEFFFGRAKKEWNSQHPVDAMYNLGIATHLVQDLTVPHHSRLINTPCNQNDSHAQYERYVWETYIANTAVGSVAGDYSNLTAKDWVIRNAGRSYDFSLDPVVSSGDSVRLGVSSSVGIIVSFIGSLGLSDFYYLSGTLSYADGTPATGSVVAYERTSANLGNNIWTSDGTYRMALFPGTYGVYGSVVQSYTNSYLYTPYNYSEPIFIDSDETLNIREPTYQFYHVRGRVTDTRGTGLADVTVLISGSCSGGAWTSPDGSYDAVVIPGTYSLEFVPPSGSRFARAVVSDLDISGLASHKF